MFNLWPLRVALLAAVLLFALITLGLCAGFAAKLHHFDDGFLVEDVSTPAYASLGIAVSVLTLLTLGPMLIIDLLRRGAVTSWILVELAVTGVLWVLWLAAAGDTTGALGGATVDCAGTVGDAATICHEYQAMQAFEFLNWILLMVYFGLVLTVAVVGHVRGHDSWHTTVRDADFSSNHAHEPVPMTQTKADV